MRSRRLRAFALIQLLVVLLMLSEAAAAEHHQIFLLGGQSNMRGATQVTDLPAGSPLLSLLPAVQINYDDEQPVPTAFTPLPRDVWTALGPYAGARFGPELSFGHALNNTDPAGNYSLIKYSGNGTSAWEDWNPSGPNNDVYDRFSAHVSAALSSLPVGDTYEIAGFLWVQGIADARDARSTTQYQQDLENLFAAIRGDYGTDLPVFMARSSINHTAANNGRGGAVVPNHPDYGLSGNRTAQENAAADDPLTYLIDTDLYPTGASHYTASGQVQLGEAFAQSYFAHVPEPATLTIACVLLTIGSRRPRR